MKPKPNITLWIALAIPVVMILLVAGAIYLPTLWSKPATNFVFTLGGDNYYGPIYGVQGVRLAIVQNRPQPTPPIGSPSPVYAKPKLYLYNVKTDTAQELTLNDALLLLLSDSPTSPDGYEIATADGGGDFLLFSGPRDYGAKYIKGHGISRKLNIPNTTNEPYYYSDSFHFVGWSVQQ